MARYSEKQAVRKLIRLREDEYNDNNTLMGKAVGVTPQTVSQSLRENSRDAINPKLLTLVGLVSAGRIYRDIPKKDKEDA